MKKTQLHLIYFRSYVVDLEVYYYIILHTFKSFAWKKLYRSQTVILILTMNFWEFSCLNSFLIFHNIISLIL